MPQTLDFSNSVTFNVDKVEIAKPTQSTSAKSQMEKLFGHSFEACDGADDPVLELRGFHSLVAAMDKAYRDHFPFALTPDVFWITIAQGFSAHVNKHSEQLRKIFVDHENKKEIKIQRDYYVKGSPDNAWYDAFPEFAEQIKECIGAENHSLVVADFSTTDISEKCVSEIALMEAMKSYFNYTCHTMCGIPQVSIFGTVEDWEKIQDRVNQLEAFGLGFWTKRLKPICEELVKASKGEPSVSFFQQMYKESGGSGGPYINGWCTHLFPYTYDRYASYNKEDPVRLNHMLDRDIGSQGGWGGLTHGTLPASFSKVPMKWNYFGEIYDMQLMGGVVTATQHANGTIIPQARWAVAAVADLTPDTAVEGGWI